MSGNSGWRELCGRPCGQAGPGASGGGDVGGELGLVFGLGELVAESGGFGAILLGLLAVLNGANGAEGVEDFAHGIVFLAGVFELVCEVVLLRGVGIEFVDAADKILDAFLALGLDDDGIGGGCVGGIPDGIVLLL